MTADTAALDALLVDPELPQDPYPTYARLREAAPVHRSDTLGGWYVTRHADVKAALRDSGALSNFGWELRYLERLPDDVRASLPTLFQHFGTPGLINADPPLHTRLRRLVGGAFVPRAIERIRDHVADVVDELLAAAPTGRIDVIRDLAYPLPTIIIAELFGAPREDRDRFKSWSTELTSFFATPTPDPARAARADASMAAFRSYLADLIEQRRAAPTDDVISKLVAGDGADAAGDALTENEILATCVIFLVAGHETTTNLIANTLLALFRNPTLLEGARDDPARVTLAVEETLRFDGPIQRIRRMASTGTEIGGRSIPAGDPVFLVLAAANRDPEVFAAPDRFDPDRDDLGHLAFGHGIHFCLGAALARLEAPIAIQALLARRPPVALRDGWQPRYVPSPTFRALVELPLAERPAAGRPAHPHG